MDRGGQVAAGQLVFTLGAGFDAGQAVPDRIVDRLVIAAFEMQEGVMLDAAPVAAIQAVVAQHVPGTGDPLAVAARHPQHDTVGPGRLQAADEVAVEIGTAPFATAGVHVEFAERVTVFVGPRLPAEASDTAARGNSIP